MQAADRRLNGWRREEWGGEVRPCEEGEGSAPSGTCALGCTLGLMEPGWVELVQTLCGLWPLSRVPDWICHLGQHLGSQAALEGSEFGALMGGG